MLNKSFGVFFAINILLIIEVVAQIDSSAINQAVDSSGVDTSSVVKKEFDFLCFDCHPTLDTSFFTYHYFYSKTPENFQSAGNFGSLRRNIYNSVFYNPGFQLGYRSEYFDIQELKDIHFSYHGMPYSHILFSAGSKNSQFIHVNHSQNIGKNFAAQLYIKRYSGDGFYQDQKTSVANHSIMITSNRNNKIYGDLKLLASRSKLMENGGFLSAEMNDPDLTLASPNISAGSEYILRSYAGVLGIRLNPVYKNTTDSLYKLNTRFVGVEYGFQYDNKKYHYTDEQVDSSFYANLYPIASAKILDSSNREKVSHKLTYRLESKDIAFSVFGFYNTNHLVIIEDSLTSEVKLTDNIGVGIGFKHLGLWNGHGQTQYFVSGENKNDAIVEYSAHKLIDKNWLLLSADGKFQSIEVPYVYRSQFEPVLSSWKKTSLVELGVGINSKKLLSTIELKYHNVVNPFFIGVDGLVSQQNNRAVKSYLVYHFLLPRKNGLNLNFRLSKRLVNNSIYPIPDLMAFVDVNVQYRLFKKALLMQTGIAATYFTKYLALGYNPYMRDFQLQDNTLVGDYPWVEFYINAQIKRVGLFVKLSHINAYFMKENYQITPLYPENPFAFKFGLNWDFRN